MNRRVGCAGLFLLVLIPALCDALKMEKPKGYEVGDKVTHNRVNNNKTFHVEDETIADNPTEWTQSSKVGDRVFDVAITKEPFAVARYFCIGGLVQCSFDPPILVWSFLLKKSKSWSDATIVTSDAFKSKMTCRHG